jgi:5-methylcytosine-specific restriction endonuclease McrA
VHRQGRQAAEHAALMPWDTSPEKRRRDSRVYGAGWRRARLACLRRCRWRCEIRLPGCQGAASEVDHIVPVAAGGTHDQANLRGACGACHAKVTAQQGGGYRRGRNGGDDPSPRPGTQWLLTVSTRNFQ